VKHLQYNTQDQVSILCPFIVSAMEPGEGQAQGQAQAQAQGQGQNFFM
jgi:hypothetical protein